MNKTLKISLFILVSIIFLTSNLSTPKALAGVKKIDSVKELHKVLVKKGLIYVDNNGQLIISPKVIKHHFDKNLLSNYEKDIKSINFGIQHGIIRLDNDLNPILLNRDDIINEMQLEAQSKKILTDMTSITPLHIIGPPDCYVASLVSNNRSELEDVYNSAMVALELTGVGNPYETAVGYFTGKVMPYGDWDYKRVDGYAPWYTEFTCYLFNSKTEVHTSEWIGNYNYGFVGQFLFSESVLLDASQGVSILFHHEQDSQDDIDTIKVGYSDGDTYGQ